MAVKKNFQKKINAIGQKFLLKLKDDLPFLESSLANKIKGEDRDETLRKLHKIAGSAKIFGFEKLGNFAATIENNFKNKIFSNEGFIDFLREAKSIVKDDDVTRDLAGQASREIGRKALKTKNGAKILIVDDDELICDMLSEHFHRLGYSVLSAKNGKEALEIITKQKPNIVILDYMMPVLDGIAALKKIKSNPKISDIPVVMLTVKSQQENILQGLKSGASDYVTKPFDIEELSQRVIGILNRLTK